MECKNRWDKACCLFHTRWPNDAEELTLSCWIAFLAPSNSTTNLQSVSQLPFSKSETCTATSNLLSKYRKGIMITTQYTWPHHSRIHTYKLHARILYSKIKLIRSPEIGIWHPNSLQGVKSFFRNYQSPIYSRNLLPLMQPNNSLPYNI